MPPQFVSPAWHESPHFPAEHTLPAGQALPHLPQLALSVAVSTHAPAHTAIDAP